MALIVVTPPAVEPVTLEQLKIHARVDHNDDDGTLQINAIAARQYVERYTGRPLINTTFELVWDAFPREGITLPKAPMQSVTSVKYLNAVTGTETTLDPSRYTADIEGDPGRVLPTNEGWPPTHNTINAVRIRFVAGYGDDPDNVPFPLREAVLKIATLLYEGRAPSSIDASYLPSFGVGDMLNEYREWSF